MHIGCTSHGWQTDCIRGQSINGYQWWLISSLIAVDWKTDQLIDHLSIIWAVVWSIDQSVGHADAQAVVWSVLQATIWETVYQVVDRVSDISVQNYTDCCVFSSCPCVGFSVRPRCSTFGPRCSSLVACLLRCIDYSMCVCTYYFYYVFLTYVRM